MLARPTSHRAWPAPKGEPIARLLPCALAWPRSINGRQCIDGRPDAAAGTPHAASAGGPHGRARSLPLSDGGISAGRGAARQPRSAHGRGVPWAGAASSVAPASGQRGSGRVRSTDADSPGRSHFWVTSPAPSDMCLYYPARSIPYLLVASCTPPRHPQTPALGATACSGRRLVASLSALVRPAAATVTVIVNVSRRTASPHPSRSRRSSARRVCAFLRLLPSCARCHLTRARHAAPSRPASDSSGRPSSRLSGVPQYRGRTASPRLTPHYVGLPPPRCSPSPLRLEASRHAPPPSRPLCPGIDAPRPPSPTFLGPSRQRPLAALTLASSITPARPAITTQHRRPPAPPPMRPRSRPASRSP